MSKKTRIYLVRHGSTSLNKQNIFQGSTDAHLDPEGKGQAVDLKDYIVEKGLEFDAIYTSKLVRTQETAAPLAEALGIEPQVLEGVEELDGGDLEGKSLREPRTGKVKEYFDISRSKPGLVECPNGESGQDVYIRAVTAFEKIVDKHEGESVIIFTHGFVLMMLLGYFYEEDLADIPYRVSPNTAVTYVEIDEDNNLELILERRANHLND